MSPDAYIYAGNWGHHHTITIVNEDGDPVDLSGASNLYIRFRDPDDNVVQKTAALPAGDDGSEGRVRYTVEEDAGVDDEPGEWTREGVAVFSNGSYQTTLEKYPVRRPLSVS